MNDSKRATVWAERGEQMVSGYRNVTYEQWCGMEIERVKTHGRVWYVETNPKNDKEIALFRA